VYNLFLDIAIYVDVYEQTKHDIFIDRVFIIMTVLTGAVVVTIVTAGAAAPVIGAAATAGGTTGAALTVAGTATGAAVAGTTGAAAGVGAGVGAIAGAVTGGTAGSAVVGTVVGSAASAGVSSLGSGAAAVAVGSGPIGWLVLGADVATFDCWKPVLRDTSTEPSSGKLLQEVIGDWRVKKITVVEQRNKLPQLTLTNIWDDHFAIEYLTLPYSTDIWAHAVPIIKQN